MLKWFYCKDGQRIEVAKCLDECRMLRRCLTKPTLVAVSAERTWTGTASTTQLLNGTMYAYLKLTQNFAIRPQSMAYSLLGISHHRKLEEIANELDIPAEVAVGKDSETTGILDLLEIEQGQVVLSDYKSWGSYKAAKVMGLKGMPDVWEVEMQLNNYRIKLLDEFGIVVDRMQVQVCPRDGRTANARSNGITDDMEIFLIDVAMRPDDEVREYFGQKAWDLKQALEHGWDRVCTATENWSGRRCAGFCEVSDHCPRSMKV